MRKIKQAIVEGAGPNRTPKVSDFLCLDIKHIQSVLRGSKRHAHNVFSHHHYHNVMLTISISQHHFYSVFLTILFSQHCPSIFLYTCTFLRLSHNILLSTSFAQ